MITLARPRGSRDKYIIMERHGRRALPVLNRQRYLVRASCSAANNCLAQFGIWGNPGYQGPCPTPVIQHLHAIPQFKNSSIGANAAL